MKYRFDWEYLTVVIYHATFLYCKLGIVPSVFSIKSPAFCLLGLYLEVKVLGVVNTFLEVAGEKYLIGALNYNRGRLGSYSQNNLKGSL
jgi:hypothetical protein